MTQDWVQTVAGHMPGVVDDLTKLVAIPSCAFPGFSAEPVLAMAEATASLLKRSGAENARLVEVPDGYPTGLRRGTRSPRCAHRLVVRPLRRSTCSTGTGLE